MNEKNRHPCFNFEAKHKYGRVHLPVAKDCNIQCNYCNRKFDCVNESRPGVTSALLSPRQALSYLIKVRAKNERISTAGIAGPGDPFANVALTMETLKLIRREFPALIICLSTNGLNISPYIEELSSLRVSHITITVNGVLPVLLARIYSWVRYDKRVYRGIEAGKLLLEKQLESINKLKEKGIIVKINSIILPGINDRHILEIARRTAEAGADLINCIPVYPVRGRTSKMSDGRLRRPAFNGDYPNHKTVLGDMKEPSAELMDKIYSQVSSFLPVMKHCARCRADAVGLLGEDDSECLKMLKECSRKLPGDYKNKPNVAVATYEGILVNRHLGEADVLHIFSETGQGYKSEGIRYTPSPGTGDLRWKQLADLIKDCRVLLVSGVGNKPLTILNGAGIKVIEMTGFIEEGLDAAYKGRTLRSIRKRDMFKCGTECSGAGAGCG